jgi:NADH dehydrogenase FAD-containing subunit
VIGTPLAFADIEYAEKAWVKFGDIPALQRSEVRFLHGTVEKVDSAAKRARIAQHGTGAVIEETYDILVAASGLRRAFPVVPQSLTRKQYLHEAQELIHTFTQAQDGVVIVGGGEENARLCVVAWVPKPANHNTRNDN